MRSFAAVFISFRIDYKIATKPSITARNSTFTPVNTAKYLPFRAPSPAPYSRNEIRLASDAISVPSPPRSTPSASAFASCVNGDSSRHAGTLLMT